MPIAYMTQVTNITDDCILPLDYYEYERKQLHRLEIDGRILGYANGHGIQCFGSVVDGPFAYEFDSARIPVLAYELDVEWLDYAFKPGPLFNSGLLDKTHHMPQRYWGLLTYNQVYTIEDYDLFYEKAH